MLDIETAEEFGRRILCRGRYAGQARAVRSSCSATEHLIWGIAEDNFPGAYRSSTCISPGTLANLAKIVYEVVVCRWKSGWPRA